MSAKMKVLKTIEIDIPDLSNKIKAARAEDGRSISEICRQLNMSRTHWYRIEDGNFVLPLETLRRIEGVLNVDFGANID